MRIGRLVLASAFVACLSLGAWADGPPPAVPPKASATLMSVRLGAVDVEATAGFYERAFGFIETARVELGGHRLEIFLAFDRERTTPGRDVMLAILGRASDDAVESLSHLVLRVADVDEAFARAVAEGAVALQSPRDYGTSGTRIALFADPAGNPVELVQRP